MDVRGGLEGKCSKDDQVEPCFTLKIGDWAAKPSE